MTKFWVAYGNTESGDDLEILLFSTKPENKKIEEIYKELYPYEYEEVGFVNWNLTTATVVE